MRHIANESGRTMLEMLGVLAIMGVIMYGAIAGIGFGVESYKINATYNMIEDLSQGIVDLYSWSRSYGPTGAGAANSLVLVACKNNVVECNSRGDEITSQWNTGINVTSEAGGAYFAIRLVNLSRLACGRLRDMTYSQLCVWKGNDDGCPVDSEGHKIIADVSDCTQNDGDCDLVLISL